jgi:hypothetical protein
VTIPSAPATADTDSGAEAPPYDLEKEIAWARAHHGEDLAGVSFESLAERLAAWVPQGEKLTVYVSSDELACLETELERPPPAVAEAESPSVIVVDTEGPPERLHSLAAKIIVSQKKRGDVLERDFRLASFGHFFETESAGGTERLKSGRVISGEGMAMGEPDQYHGTLSSIDDEVAVFGGVPVVAFVRCEGPFEWRSCPSGGERRCDSCKLSRVDIEEHPPGSRLTAPQTFYSRLSGECTDPCPKREPPDRDRIDTLFASALAWKLVSGSAPAPALYISRKRCLAERKKR